MKSFTFIFLSLFFLLNASDPVFEKTYIVVNWGMKNIRKHPIASSFLIERGKPKEQYSADKIHDTQNENWRETAWCVSRNQGINEYIYIPYWNHESKNRYRDVNRRGEYYVSFAITNGFAKSKELFFANNRVKKVSIEIQEIAYSYSDDRSSTAKVDGKPSSIFIYDGPLLHDLQEINLEDTMDEQNFKLKIIPKSKKQEVAQMDLLFKIVIKEIYPGSKYKDTCISDANFEMVVPEDKKK